MSYIDKVKYTFNKLAIFSTESDLYITNEDYLLIKITGKDKDSLEFVLLHLQESDDLDEVFIKICDYFQGDRDYYDLIINYLISQNIIVLIDEPQKKNILTKRVIIVGRFLDKELLKKSFIEKLSNDHIEYNLIDILPPDTDVIVKYKLIDIDIIIIFPPLLGSIANLSYFSYEAYSSGVPILHIGTGTTSLTLGPLIDPKSYTASLICYMKRIASSLENPSTFLTISEMVNKKYLLNIDVLLNPNFNLLVEFIKLELTKYFLKNKNTILIGREIRLNLVDYSTSNNKILKTF